VLPSPGPWAAGLGAGPVTWPAAGGFRAASQASPATAPAATADGVAPALIASGGVATVAEPAAASAREDAPQLPPLPQIGRGDDAVSFVPVEPFRCVHMLTLTTVVLQEVTAATNCEVEKGC
jgi:hypothetical protein